MSNALLPDDWLVANITPVFKSGDHSVSSNYYISLTCFASKIMETIFCDYVIDTMLQNNIISQHQHGFLQNHAMCSYLLECLNMWLDSYENHMSTHIIYINFEKAFHIVSPCKINF